MRTIKDPKKRPDLRRRVEPLEEPEEEDAKSTKSTPPKKRKTAKSTKDENTALNDSGSFVDNQSDIVSERSSLVGDDDASDISSLKSTPPKKRTYNRIVKGPEATAEINGDLHETPDSTPEKKIKGRKKKKSGDETSTKSTPEKTEGEKKSSKLKKNVKQSTAIESPAQAEKTDNDTKKKTSGTKKKEKLEQNVDDKAVSVKKKPGRKRKLSGPQGDSGNSDTLNKMLTENKPDKKSKKLLSKEEEQLELKRQTEELRSDKSSLKEIKNGEIERDKLKAKSKKIPVKKSPLPKAVSDNVKTSPVKSDEAIHKKESNVDNLDYVKEYKRDNDDDKSDSETDIDEKDDESSELETSFESINSHRDEEDNIDETKNQDVDKQNDKNKENEIKAEQSIKCDQCGYVSRSKGGHTRHLRKCQPEKLGLEVDLQSKTKLHKCEECDYVAPKRVIVINHMHMHGIFQCKRCKYRTDNEETLTEHCALEHKDRSDCKFCKNCNRYVKCSETPLEKHMEECQGRIPFKCPECSKEFQYESSLKCHVVSHYPNKPKLFSCDQCDYKSNYKANLKKHIRHIHEQRGERNIKCLECEKMFFTEDNMRRHLKLHSEERPYKCDKSDCDKAFKTLTGLKLHVVSHKTDRPFPCEFDGCEKSFKTKRSLVLHLNETHQNAPRNYKCMEEGCDMAFYKKCHLDRHMDAHKDNRNHFCTFITCTKAFRTADSLKVHMLFHLDQKPLKCEHCDYTCRQKASIRFHMKKKHPELVKNDLTKPKATCSAKNSNQSGSKELADKAESIKPETQSAELSDTVKASCDLDTGIPSDSESSNHANQTPLTSSLNEKTEQDAMRTSVDSDHSVKSDASGETAVTANQNSSDISHSTNENKAQHKSSSEIALKNISANEIAPKKAKKTDMYEFQSEDESEDEMKPGLLRKDYDKDKPPLPPVDSRLLDDIDLPQADNIDKAVELEKSKKERKKPGPKPKPKVEKPPARDQSPKVPKKRGRKKKSETEKQINKEEEKEEEEEVKEESECKQDEIEEDREKEKLKEKMKAKPSKRGRSPKGKKAKEVKAKIVDEDDDDEDEEETVLVKKKRGPKKKTKVEKVGEKAQKVPKKRGRKSKAEKQAELEKKKEIEPENGDATINYSEVESSELFGDSKDSMPEKFKNEILTETVTSDAEKENEVKEVDFSGLKKDDDNDNEDEKSDVDANADSKTSVTVLEKVEDRKKSDSESSDIGSDFDEDLKPPPAPRPPPICDSEDGDIESGPENEDFNTSAMSNEPLRDFESSREISREISRDFESSREIDDSVKTSEYINSVETSTPKDAIGTPASVNPYKNDSVNNEHENPQSHHSHHSSVPHTPSHNSVPTTPATHEFPESRSIEQQPTGDRILKNPVHGHTNEENTDESSMPEVDKDYVGRYFAEIQCNQVQPENQLSCMNSIDENSKSQDKIVETPRSDSGVPSSLNSNQTDASLQMQSPQADLSHKRMDLISPERPTEPHYHARSESVHNRSSDRISVPTYDAQYPAPNPIDPYNSSIPSRNTILRQPEQTKPAESPTSAPSYMRFPDSDAMLQRQRFSAPYDRNLQNLHRITEAPLGQHNSTSPLLRHVPGREEMFTGSAGVTGSMGRNPFHSSWTGQDVRPPHWGHPTYLQQQSGSTASSLFGAKDSYLPGREFMFDPSRAAAERNMFTGLTPSSHTQRPDIPHDTFQFDRFDIGNYFSYNTPPSLPVDYTRSAHSTSQKALDERYRQTASGVSEYRSLPPSSSASDMFGVNSTFNFDKFYSRDPVYHSQHIGDNSSNPFLSGVASQPMFGRDYSRSFYTQNPTYPFMNMNEKNYPSAASAKLGHATDPVGQQRDLVPVPRPNMAAPDSQLQDPYRHSSMLYNMMNKYF